MRDLTDRLLGQPWRAWTPLWTHRHRARGWFLHLGLLAIFTVLITVGYGATNWFSAWRGVSLFDPSTDLDRSIPGWSWTMIFYSSYYLLFLVMCLSAPRTNRGRLECMLAFQAMIVGSFISFAIFLIAPVEVGGRDNLDDPGLLSSMFSSLHAVDPPFNSWPSLHVLDTIIASWFIVRWWTVDGSRRAMFSIAIPMWTLCALIALSTLTTKQHYIWDIVTAAALALLLLWVTRRGLDAMDVTIAAARFEADLS